MALGFLSSDPTPGGIVKPQTQIEHGVTKTFSSLQFPKSDGKWNVKIQFTPGADSLAFEFMDKSNVKRFQGNFNKEAIRRITNECRLSAVNLNEVITDQLSSADFINKFCRIFECSDSKQGICALYISDPLFVYILNDNMYHQ